MFAIYLHPLHLQSPLSSPIIFHFKPLALYSPPTFQLNPLSINLSINPITALHTYQLQPQNMLALHHCELNHLNYPFT